MIRRTLLTVSTIILLGAVASVAQGAERCPPVPDTIKLNEFVVKAEGEAVRLESIDWATKLKWTIGILVPNLVKDEVGIHLYKPEEIDQLDRGLKDDHIILFIVCKSGENSYWARRATIPKGGTNSQSGNPNEDDHLFLGATVPIPRWQQNTPELVDSVRGNLRAFQPLTQSNTTVQ